MEKLTVITWLWKGSDWRQTYTAQHVNALQRMVAANLKIPHKFICITDIPEGIECETMGLIDIGVKSIIPTWPNCYNRLKAFDLELGKKLGNRFISMDLDCVITGDITELFTRKKDFIILEGRACHYNGSLWMMDAGARQRVWDDFDPVISPIMAMQGQNKNGTRFFGSDQAWISFCLGAGEAIWELGQDGLYQFTEMEGLVIPNDAKLVFFAGDSKPWTETPFSALQTIYNKYKGS